MDFPPQLNPTKIAEQFKEMKESAAFLASVVFKKSLDEKTQRIE